MTRLRWLLAVYLVLLPAMSQAGAWGQEKWGQMYWGDNPVTVPMAPSIRSIVAEESSITVQIDDYQAGNDGWSLVTNYAVTCGQAESVTSPDNLIRITGLDSGTDYRCSVTATNVRGESESSVALITTEAELQGLNLILIRSALCASDNPPDNC